MENSILEVFESVMGYGGIAAFIGALIGLPVSYGVLVRADGEFDYGKLPKILRFSYWVENIQDTLRKKSSTWKYPELYSFVPMMIFIGFIFIRLLGRIDSDSVQIGTLLEKEMGAFIFSGFLLFWWIVFVGGTELWLYYKWIPRNRIS